MPIRRSAVVASLAAAIVAGTSLFAADGPAKPKSAAKPATKPTTAKSGAPEKDYWTSGMDYGPFLMTSVSRPAAKKYSPKPLERANVPKFPVDPMTDLVAGKGLVVRLNSGKYIPMTVCYDLDTMSLLIWSNWGPPLDLTGTMLTNHKGVSQVTMPADARFTGTTGVAWGGGPDGRDFVDPRKDRVGPLPEDRVRLDRIHLAGEAVVLAYRVAGQPVLETVSHSSPTGVARTLRLEATDRPMTLAVTDVPPLGKFGKFACGKRFLKVDVLDDKVPYDSLVAGLAGDLAGVEFRHDEKAARVFIDIAPSPHPRVFEVVYEGCSEMKEADFAERRAPSDPKRLLDVNALPPSKPIITTGKPGSAPAKSGKKAADPAFVVDEVTLPFDNPSKSWLRLSGLDFFPDGRAAVCTINGDVWIASGLDEKLDKVTWTRFATGLYHPMGLAVVDGEVYVRSRDFLLRLKDVNHDGTADSYEVVTGEGVAHPSYHGFVFDLQADAAGNFYYARGGIGMDPNLAGHGLLTKVSKDGKTVTPLAGGLRAPNGLGVVGPGWITVSDNQGNWIPSSKVHLIDPAAAVSPGNPPFLGFLPHHHQPTMPKAPDRPFVWIPHKLDNSSGGQCQIPANAWGPYGGQWIHSSFGAACVTLLLPDDNTPAGQLPAQGAVVKLPLDFATGVMRPRFNPKDGQLYVAGVGGGWQTKGTADGGLYRVRFTGQPGLAPTRFALVPGGVRLTFAQPLDKTEATDVQNYAVEQWNYQWSEKYGSPDFSAKDPKKAGHDEVEVKAAELSADGKTVTLRLGTQVVVDQLRIQCNLKTAAGAELEQEVFTTVNQVPAK
ncbi:MAG TPA: DUF6797 domain-containing protein [Humisphaera sp.]